jgi:hypothetical protein
LTGAHLLPSRNELCRLEGSANTNLGQQEGVHPLKAMFLLRMVLVAVVIGMVSPEKGWLSAGAFP